MKTTLQIIGAILIAILLFYSGCSIQKGKCLADTPKTIYVEKVVYDTFYNYLPGKTIFKPSKEIIVLMNDKQKDSLIEILASKLDYTRQLADYYAAQIALINNAQKGDIVESVAPYNETSGEALNNDSTVTVRWRVKVFGNLQEATAEMPNPVFNIESRQTTKIIDLTKPRAIGVGVGAKLGIDGRGIDAIPLAYYRKGTTVYFGRYHIRGKAAEIGVAKELQF